MKGRLLGMDEKTMGSKMVERDRSKGPGVDMMRRRYPNTVISAKVEMDTRIGKTMTMQGEGRERRPGNG